MTSTGETFAENMKRMREELGWSQGELGRRLAVEGVTAAGQMTISRIEHGKRVATLDEWDAVARVFQADRLDLIDPEPATIAERANAAIARLEAIAETIGSQNDKNTNN